MANPDRQGPMSQLTRVLIAIGVGAAAAIVAALTLPWQSVPLIGWVAAALTWVIPLWITVLRLGPEGARAYATREDPTGPVATSLLLAASVAALVAVLLGVLKASDAHGDTKALLVTAGITAIMSSWALVHTVFTLRYADIYYNTAERAVDFNEDAHPDYADFAYLSFTIGMTYQVSDTNLASKRIRRAALQHALLSYLFGTIIIAATINLVAGLVK